MCVRACASTILYVTVPSVLYCTAPTVHGVQYNGAVYGVLHPRHALRMEHPPSGLARTATRSKRYGTVGTVRYPVQRAVGRGTPRCTPSGTVPLVLYSNLLFHPRFAPRGATVYSSTISYGSAVHNGVALSFRPAVSYYTTVPFKRRFPHPSFQTPSCNRLSHIHPSIQLPHTLHTPLRFATPAPDCSTLLFRRARFIFEILVVQHRTASHEK